MVRQARTKKEIVIILIFHSNISCYIPSSLHVAGREASKLAFLGRSIITMITCPWMMNNAYGQGLLEPIYEPRHIKFFRYRE